MPALVNGNKIFAGALQAKVFSKFYSVTYNFIKINMSILFRFMYHFTGMKQTNRFDKPEWFYTQILNWGKETHLFVGKTFQPSAVKAGKLDYNIRVCSNIVHKYIITFYLYPKNKV